MGENAALKARMRELELTQVELARRLNTAIEALTGAYGTISEHTIYEMVSGKTRWPRSKTRAALTEVLGRAPQDLGFQPPRSAQPSIRPEPPVRRRNFLGSAISTAAVAALPVLSTPAVGTTDVLRLRKRLDTLTGLDQTRGGHGALERAATEGAESALVLNRRAASERIHQRLYSLAADYTTTAAFSAIDSQDLETAQRHLDRAGTYAGLSQDSAIQLRVWIITAMLAHHQGRHSDAVAAGHAALATGAARRDPFYASLGHARTAIGYAGQRDRQAALRSLGLAWDAMGRAASDPSRPSWTSFYGPAELRAMAAVTHQLLGEPEQAEAASHQALATIPAEFRRNRALATGRLAIAQVRQAEAEQACVSAHRVFDLMAGDPLPARMRVILGDFHRSLLTVAPNAPETLEWTHRARLEWSRTT